jgi:hypothetical protein
MDCARLTKLPLPEATVSVRTLPSRPKVFDESAVPDDLCKFSRKPDLDAIKEAIEHGAVIPGVTITNGGASLSVRRK